jgi:predicted YcjX-like family ATPase
MATIPWLPPIITETAKKVVDELNLSELTDGLSDLSGSTVWLAVTGLSRSGKTVFITSLIHNLLSAMNNPHRMPLLNVVAEGRLSYLGLESAGAGRLPRFPYEKNIEAMAAASPDWPPRTADISEIGLEIRFRPSSAVGKLIGRLSTNLGASNLSRISFKIVDYPGEWLLDLPLLSQSYAEWSRSTLQLYRKGHRAEAASEFLAFIGDHRYSDPADEDIAHKAHELFRAFLFKARDQFGLSFLQPGRFLCPGGLGDVPYLWFAPLDVPAGLEVLPADTLGALMAERYEVYKREVVTKFYDELFRRYSRQIVLVDILRALLAGQETFEDTQLAINAILQSFRFGSGTALSKFIRGAHISRVLFAATKADHVPDVQRDHLSELLRNMVASRMNELKGWNTRLDVVALASVISTMEDTQEIDGQRVQVVVGRPVGTTKQAKFFVGNVPSRPPRAAAWGSGFLNVPVFEPPAIDPSPVEGIPHINLDLALEFLIGDRLR